MQRKIIRQVKFKIEDKKKILVKRYKKKIKRYLDIQGKMKVDSLSFTLPESIKKIEDLSVFAENGFENVDPNLLERPMICDKNIVLCSAEIAVLSKGPEFAVWQEILEEDFKMELEKMVFKRKYSSAEDEFHADNSSQPFTAMYGHSRSFSENTSSTNVCVLQKCSNVVVSDSDNKLSDSKFQVSK